VSCRVVLTACPMWRGPVMLGGGLTMENGGRDESTRAVNTPSVSQWVYQRSSIRAGSNVLSNSMAETVKRGPGRQKKQAREPSIAPVLRGVGRRLSIYEPLSSSSLIRLRTSASATSGTISQATSRTTRSARRCTTFSAIRSIISGVRATFLPSAAGSGRARPPAGRCGGAGSSRSVGRGVSHAALSAGSSTVCQVSAGGASGGGAQPPVPSSSDRPPPGAIVSGDASSTRSNSASKEPEKEPSATAPPDAAALGRGPEGPPCL